MDRREKAIAGGTGMIRRASAIRFDRSSAAGRTEPLRVRIETDDEEECDVILKVSQSPECSVHSLAYELLGALLAADLGLPICEPFLVDLHADFISSVHPPQIQRRLQQSCSVAFGSRDAGKQWRTWSPTADNIKVEQIPLALGVIAFDAFIGNADRAPQNANMLVSGDQWRLIDHEVAFGFRLKLFPKCEPWKLGNLDLLTRWGQRSEHIFAAPLRKKEGLDFTAVINSWRDLSDVRLSQYDACLPDEWDAARSDFTDALCHIKLVRDSIELCVAELKRVLK